MTLKCAWMQMDKRDVQAKQSNMGSGNSAGGGFANPGEHGLGGGPTGKLSDLTGGATGTFKDLTGASLLAAGHSMTHALSRMHRNLAGAPASCILHITPMANSSMMFAGPT